MQSIGGDLTRHPMASRLERRDAATPPVEGSRRILGALGSVEPAIARTVGIHSFLVPPEYITTQRNPEVAAMTKRPARTR